MNIPRGPVTHLIFDFDYTLADSSRGVLSCINHALKKLGYPETTYEKSCQTIGLSLQETYAALTGDNPDNGVEFVRLFIERAEEVMADRTVLFDATPETIAALKTLGYSLGIVSTKFRYRIETILRRENLLNHFDVIVGGEDVTKHKPDPEGLLAAMKRLGGTQLNTIYTGDSVVDAKAAEQAGIPFIAVLSGVTQKDAFDSLSTICILDSVRNLPDWLGGFMQADEEI